MENKIIEKIEELIETNKELQTKISELSMKVAELANAISKRKPTISPETIKNLKIDEKKIFAEHLRELLKTMRTVEEELRKSEIKEELRKALERTRK